jgi:hypothetical protein
MRDQLHDTPRFTPGGRSSISPIERRWWNLTASSKDTHKRSFDAVWSFAPLFCGILINNRRIRQMWTKVSTGSKYVQELKYIIYSYMMRLHSFCMQLWALRGPVFNILELDFFFNFSTPVYKMWIIQEPNTLELWNKLHFEAEKKQRVYTMFKIFGTYICWINK